METLDPSTYRDLVRRALAEDLSWGDVTSAAVLEVDCQAAGVLVCRSPGVVAGLDAALEAFRQLDPSVVVDVCHQDGEAVGAGAHVARLVGAGSALLTAERTALNLFGHLCGIATATRRLVDGAGTLQVADTRKTTPLLRALEKYAVRVGGGINGRFSLDDGMVIKANHVRLAGGVTIAVASARRGGADVPVEVEVQSLPEVDEALAAGASVLLMREPSLEELGEAARRCEHRARIEVSGRFGPEALPGLAACGADLVSIGWLIDSAPALDVSLELDRL